jgi:hypothetical protein
MFVNLIHMDAAKNLGFTRSPLAYLVLKSRNYLIPSALTRGVSYASAGAGILDSTVRLAKFFLGRQPHSIYRCSFHL